MGTTVTVETAKTISRCQAEHVKGDVERTEGKAEGLE